MYLWSNYHFDTVGQFLVTYKKNWIAAYWSNTSRLHECIAGLVRVIKINSVWWYVGRGKYSDLRKITTRSRAFDVCMILKNLLVLLFAVLKLYDWLYQIQSQKAGQEDSALFCSGQKLILLLQSIKNWYFKIKIHYNIVLDKGKQL